MARNPRNYSGTFAPYKNLESGIVGRAGPQDYTDDTDYGQFPWNL